MTEETGNNADVIYGGAGNDFVLSGFGDDEIYMGKGSDTVFGDTGDDFISGGENGGFKEKAGWLLAEKSKKYLDITSVCL